MIYKAIVSGKRTGNNNNTDTVSNATILISGLNDANALDILGKYLDKGIDNITYFKMIGEYSDGNIINVNRINNV